MERVDQAVRLGRKTSAVIRAAIAELEDEIRVINKVIQALRILYEGRSVTIKFDDDPDAAERLAGELARARNPDAVALGRLGGMKGGRARAARLTPEQRSEAASKAARARWARP